MRVYLILIISVFILAGCVPNNVRPVYNDDFVVHPDFIKIYECEEDCNVYQLPDSRFHIIERSTRYSIEIDENQKVLLNDSNKKIATFGDILDGEFDFMEYFNRSMMFGSGFNFPNLYVEDEDFQYLTGVLPNITSDIQLHDARLGFKILDFDIETDSIVLAVVDYKRIQGRVRADIYLIRGGNVSLLSSHGFSKGNAIAKIIFSSSACGSPLSFNISSKIHDEGVFVAVEKNSHETYTYLGGSGCRIGSSSLELSLHDMNGKLLTERSFSDKTPLASSHTIVNTFRDKYYFRMHENNLTKINLINLSTNKYDFGYNVRGFVDQGIILQQGKELYLHKFEDI